MHIVFGIIPLSVHINHICCLLIFVLHRCLLPTQAYPFVARKVLRDDGSGTAALLRDLVYDERGNLRPGRLSALLQVHWRGGLTDALCMQQEACCVSG